MPLYEFRCDKCGETQDLFYNMNDEHPDDIQCNKCEGRAIRIFSIGAAYLKKKRIGDIWDEAGVTSRSTPKTKEANAERIRRMREQNKINIEKKRRYESK